MILGTLWSRRNPHPPPAPAPAPPHTSPFLSLRRWSNRVLLPTGSRSLATCSSLRLTRTAPCGSAERASIPRCSHATRKLVVVGSRLNRGRVVVNGITPVCKGEGQHESGERPEWFVTSSHPSHGLQVQTRRLWGASHGQSGVRLRPYLPPDTTADNTAGQPATNKTANAMDASNRCTGVQPWSAFT